MTFNNFEVPLLKRAINRGGLHLYQHDDAMLLVGLCKKHNIQVLGIDAFFISDGKTHPKMEHSIDLSLYSIIEANESAYKFLAERNKLDLVYEIIY